MPGSALTDDKLFASMEKYYLNLLVSIQRDRLSGSWKVLSFVRGTANPRAHLNLVPIFPCITKSSF